MPYRSRDERLAYQRAYRQRPEVKAREREYRGEYRQRPEVVPRRKKRENAYQRTYRAKSGGAERALKRRLGEARRHDHRYWARYRLACRLAKERGDRHLAREDLIAVGLRS